MESNLETQEEIRAETQNTFKKYNKTTLQSHFLIKVMFTALRFTKLLNYWGLQ